MKQLLCIFVYLLTCCGVQGQSGATIAGCMSMRMFYDADTDGSITLGEVTMDGWSFSVQDVSDAGSSSSHYDTPLQLFLAPGTYQVCAAAPAEQDWVPTTPQCSAVTVTASDTCTDVIRGSVCVGGHHAKPLSYWISSAGQAAIRDRDVALLSALNLKLATAGNFAPASAADVVAWMSSASAAQPQHWLSVQLAVNVLNSQHFVSPGSYIVGRGVAVSAGYSTGFFPILAAQSIANTAIGTVGPETAVGIAAVLEDANNDLTFVQPGPCSYTFPSASKRAAAASESAFVYPGA